jgi:hypothetical protein
MNRAHKPVVRNSGRSMVDLHRGMMARLPEFIFTGDSGNRTSPREVLEEAGGTGNLPAGSPWAERRRGGPAAVKGQRR